MALSREDKADVSKAFGKSAAKAVSYATNDAKNKALHAKSGGKRTPGQAIRELGDKNYRRPKGQANANPEYERAFKEARRWKND